MLWTGNKKEKVTHSEKSVKCTHAALQERIRGRPKTRWKDTRSRDMDFVGWTRRHDENNDRSSSPLFPSNFWALRIRRTYG